MALSKLLLMWMLAILLPKDSDWSGDYHYFNSFDLDNKFCFLTVLIRDQCLFLKLTFVMSNNEELQRDVFRS